MGLSIRRAVLALAVFGVVCGGAASAAPIGPDISVTGGVTYDTGFSFVDNASHSGTMTVTIAGATTTTTYGATSTGFQAGTAVGANPLNGALTDTGDGFGITGTAGASASPDDAEFGIGVDVVMTITNTSGTDVWQVTVRTTFGNTVDSTGTNAYVNSEFTLDSRLSPAPPPGTEEFFSHLVTDTVNGNEVGGVPVAGSGGPLSDSGADTLVLTLNPGDTYIIEGDWTLDGGAFADVTSGAFLEDFNVSLIIADVQNISRPIPEPGTLALLGLGLVGLTGAVVRRKRKKTV